MISRQKPRSLSQSLFTEHTFCAEEEVSGLDRRCSNGVCAYEPTLSGGRHVG